MDIAQYIFRINGDDRGQLISLEEYETIPFLIKRVYYIYGTKDNVIRGKHAHKYLEQVLVCVCGKCTIRLDDGRESRTVQLDSPWKGMYIGRNIWREMYNFSPNAVLLVLASQLYDESDYIRNYEDFISYINNS